jgi:glycosyltransferase involved in cell wall biosynthesis
VIDPDHPDFASTPAAGDRPSFGYEPVATERDPCLTIVTPFFDTDPRIFEETALSVRRQSLQQFEWLIVDDGSTRQESLAALGRFDDADPRIRVLRHERNRGLPAARNTGIEHARSEFVLLLDSDDLLEPTAAEKWLWFLTSHPEHAFVKGFEVGFGDQEYLWSRGFHDGKAFRKENLASAIALVRKDAFERVGGYDESLVGGLEDWDLWLRCAAAGLWGGTVPEYLDWYRRRVGHSERWANWEGKGQKDLRRAWRRRHPELWRGAFPDSRGGSAGGGKVDLEPPSFENLLAKELRRLLLIVPYAPVGGAEKFNLGLVAQLSRKGWETTIVTTLPGDHTWLPQFGRLTPDTFALSRFLQPADYPRFLHYLIRSRRPDAILVSNSQFAYAALPYLRQIAGGTPIADYCHMEEEGWLRGGYPRLSIENGKWLDLQITASRYLKDWMVERGAEPDRVQVCHINVELPERAGRPERSGLDLPADVPLVLYPCRLTEQKQPQVFAKTVQELRRRGEPFLAIVVGGGPYFSWLRTFVRRKRLKGHVRLLGRQSHRRVQELMAVADCVFVPSRHEGILLTFYEAMAAGVPVVGAGVGGQRELVTPECGVLVERADEDTEVQRYADVLTRLLGDPQQRAEMGEAGRARIRAHFTLDRMGDRMDELLERSSQLAASTPRAAPTPEQARAAALAAVRLASWAAAQAPGRQQLPERARLALYKSIAAVGLPLHRLAMRLGLHWIDRLRHRVAQALEPEP